MTITSKCMSFTAESSGGEYSHRLTVKEMPAHSHPTVKGDRTSATNGTAKIDNKHSTYQSESEISPGYYWTARTLDEGENNKHNNIQPYIVVYFWRRIK